MNNENLKLYKNTLKNKKEGKNGEETIESEGKVIMQLKFFLQISMN